MISQATITTGSRPFRLCALLCAAIALLAAGCSTESGRKLPGVYRQDIQQGNIIDQEMLDRLRPGMDKNQVRFIMGTPAVADPFHTDRWDYVFTFSKRGARREQRHVSLYFRDNKLTHVDGDVQMGERPETETVKPQSAIVDVPSNRSGKPGFFSRMFNSLPFVNDDDKPKKRKKHVDESTDEPPEETAKANGGTGVTADNGPATSDEPDTVPAAEDTVDDGSGMMEPADTGPEEPATPE